MEAYLELLCDIINYGYLSLSLRQCHMGPKGKCKVDVWQFDVIITEKGLKRSTFPQRSSEIDASKQLNVLLKKYL